VWKVQKTPERRREEKRREERGKEEEMDEIQTLLATLPIYLGSQYKPAYPTTEPSTSTENDALLRAVGAAKDELRR